MGSRILVISKPSFLRLDLGRFQIEQEREVVGSVPLEDLAVVVLDPPGITITAELLSACAQQNVAIIGCDAVHQPLSLTLPMYGSSTHTRTLLQQIEATVPKKKRLWQQVVQAKVGAQAVMLRLASKPRVAKKLEEMVPMIGSGDPDNYEAQAASLYFPALFGNGFTRERGGDGVNAMLNYGYAVLRAMTGRALVGTGLHPALGIHHRGPYNPYNLADDAMEPLRPLVDEIVFKLWTENAPEELTPAVKRDLLRITVLPVEFAGLQFPILTALERYVATMKEGICGDQRKLQIPVRSNAAPIDSCG